MPILPFRFKYKEHVKPLRLYLHFVIDIMSCLVDKHQIAYFGVNLGTHTPWLSMQIVVSEIIDKAGIRMMRLAKNIINNNEKFRSFKSRENIHKKEVGPYRGFSQL